MKLSPEYIVAERCLVFRDGSIEAREVRVTVGKPTKSNDDEYSCQIQILGLGDEHTRSIYGVDSMQALQLALRFVSEMLQNYRDELRWLGNKEIGF